MNRRKCDDDDDDDDDTCNNWSLFNLTISCLYFNAKDL